MPEASIIARLVEYYQLKGNAEYNAIRRIAIEFGITYAEVKQAIGQHKHMLKTNKEYRAKF
jgi:hypothetical protein